MMQWLKDLMASAVQPARAPALEMAGGACGEGCGCGSAVTAEREADLEPPAAQRRPARLGGHDRVRAEPGETLAKQLALVIDLNVCVGCHACVTSCKQWNTSGSAGPLADEKPYGADPTGTFFNRVQTYEANTFPGTETIHFPKSCLHCQDPPCVPVCPTGASYKRKEDGIVLVDYDKCIGCKYCAWACPYGARELDEERQVMTKCTLCVDRIYDEKLPKEDRKPACVKACPTGARMFGDVKDPESEVSRVIRERGGYSLMPEWETNPANQYLPRRVTDEAGGPSRVQAKLGGMS
ncbi:4Fe-4S dicluster domain-containing protein [Variovorax soli]|uniref:Fe-S-cluster-containing dehydrogenase component n=1 Tax=Variovorax soli TaxID=376815 RepID=A0ABU1NEN8_9BURK|nr:4Fe-4S dicluster domain-containing protein [Variovorax soli]MDR6536803.1 Fe-S-cluster-containing dehydrogenase component [Variovorax soli]